MLMHIRPPMLIGVLTALLVGGACAEESARTAAQTRCGWWDNPTPQNVSLFDGDGEWIVAVQGGHQAEGDWPGFKASQWVNTNRSHGYGCACIDGVFDPRTHEVTRIRSAHARPLSACRGDPALKRATP